MLKKTSLIIICTFSIVSLFASSYNSNSIGQKLGKRTDNSQYYIIEEVSQDKISSKLYKDDIIIENIIISEIDGIKTISKYSNNTFLEQTFSNDLLTKEIENDKISYYNYDQNNLLTSKLVEYNDSKTIYNYLYDSNNLLSAIITIKDGDITSKFYNFNDNNIQIAITNNNQQYMESSITNGVINSIEYNDDILINNIEIENQDDENIVLLKKTENSLKKEYYNNSLLSKIETYQNDLLINTRTFEYDDNYILTKEIFTENIYNKYNKQFLHNKKSITEYTNNKIGKITNYFNEELESEYFYKDNIRIENIYENSQLYCTVTLENDKIIDIQYREVTR